MWPGAVPPRPGASDLQALLREVRSCTVCAAHLPHGPRPIVQLGRSAGIVIIGQAPGRRVHETGVPWNDPSGERLREWLGVTSQEFYDPTVVAIVPMGLCYPGSGPSGDKPPRPECAPLWHDRLLAHLPAQRLEVIVGGWAQRRYLERRGKSLTETVADWAAYLPSRAVLPHPSPRNRHWLTSNPWFETDAVPAIRDRVRQVLASNSHRADRGREG